MASGVFSPLTCNVKSGEFANAWRHERMNTHRVGQPFFEKDEAAWETMLLPPCRGANKKFPGVRLALSGSAQVKVWGNSKLVNPKIVGR